jgi:hypothetical protein
VGKPDFASLSTRSSSKSIDSGSKNSLLSPQEKPALVGFHKPVLVHHAAGGRRDFFGLPTAYLDKTSSIASISLISGLAN